MWSARGRAQPLDVAGGNQVMRGIAVDALLFEGYNKINNSKKMPVCL
jgi:hypothetical protein